MSIKEKMDAARKERMAKSGPKGPSMVPDWTPRKPKELKEPEPLPPTVEELEAQNEVSRADMMTLNQLVVLHTKLGKDERQAANAKKPVTEDIKEIVKKTPALHKTVCSGSLISYYPGDRSSVSKQKLLELGVSPAIIEKATVTTTSWTLKIRDLADLDE